MRGKVPLLILITGLLLYVFDLGSDIYVAIQYYRTDQWWWFGFTLAFIIVPVICINISACWQTGAQDAEEFEDIIDYHQDLQSYSKCLFCFSFWSCSLYFFRYGKEFTQWKRKYLDNSPCKKKCRRNTCEQCKKYLEQKHDTDKSAYMLAWLRYIETVAESAPQWCLQVYIMLRQWHFPWYTVLSTVFSLLSLAWSITALEKARHKKNGNRKFTLIPTIAFLMWQLSALVSRLSAIVYCAYVLRYYAFIFVGVYWLLFEITMVCRTLECKCEFQCPELLFGLPLIIVFSCLYLLNYTETLENMNGDSRSRYWILIINALLATHNLLMLILCLTISKFNAPYQNEVRPIAISCVVGRLILGTLFGVVYHKLCYPRDSKQTNDIPLTSSTDNSHTENI